MHPDKSRTPDILHGSYLALKASNLSRFIAVRIRVPYTRA